MRSPGLFITRPFPDNTMEATKPTKRSLSSEESSPQKRSKKTQPVTRDIIATSCGPKGNLFMLVRTGEDRYQIIKVDIFAIGGPKCSGKSETLVVKFQLSATISGFVCKANGKGFYFYAGNKLWNLSSQGSVVDTRMMGEGVSIHGLHSWGNMLYILATQTKNNGFFDYKVPYLMYGFSESKKYTKVQLEREGKLGPWIVNRDLKAAYLKLDWSVCFDSDDKKCYVLLNVNRPNATTCLCFIFSYTEDGSLAFEKYTLIGDCKAVFHNDQRTPSLIMKTACSPGDMRMLLWAGLDAILNARTEHTTSTYVRNDAVDILSVGGYGTDNWIVCFRNTAKGHKYWLQKLEKSNYIVPLN